MEREPDSDMPMQQDEGAGRPEPVADPAARTGADPVPESVSTAASDARVVAESEPDGPYIATDGAMLGRDFYIPGVENDDPNPYRWHTGEKRDHGGQDAIEVIDLVKQFG